MRALLTSMSLAVLVAGGLAAPALAAPCKDAKGKFVACPKKVVRCKNAKGLFVKCGTPGAKPM